MSIATKSARSVADVNAGMILASVEIAAPPERVFRALTTEEITQWWGSPEEYRTTSFTAELRVGGKWRTTGIGAKGDEFAVEGVYREIDSPRRLVQTWVAPWDGNNETVITYMLEPIEGGTRLTVKHEGFGERRESCSGHGEGWERVLGWLSRFLPPAQPSRFFLLRLLAPRPTFQMDLTDEERDVMRRHAGYWAGLLPAGRRGRVRSGRRSEGRLGRRHRARVGRGGDDVPVCVRSRDPLRQGVRLRDAARAERRLPHVTTLLRRACS
ncbi:MAG TPA: SRPBCC domain-containing protein [Polyangiaceae bacterium]|jgi:uncharacterized protein YndB with AHSA1/START domain|nr:SRPBCC domain-containing protein [Polyangiaceae bacterium]